MRNTSELLPVYSVLFDYLADIFLHTITIDKINKINTDELFLHFPLSLSDEEVLNKLHSLYASLDAEMISSVNYDFHKLFIGFDHMYAPPYASYYLDEDKLLNNKSTLIIRNIYHENNFHSVINENIPDDHIGVILQFIAELNRKTHSEIEEFIPAIKLQKEFINKYVVTWLEEFNSLICNYAGTPFYKLHVTLLSSIIKQFYSLLDNTFRISS